MVSVAEACNRECIRRNCKPVDGPVAKCKFAIVTNSLRQLMEFFPTLSFFRPSHTHTHTHDFDHLPFLIGLSLLFLRFMRLVHSKGLLLILLRGKRGEEEGEEEKNEQERRREKKSPFSSLCARAFLAFFFFRPPLDWPSFLFLSKSDEGKTKGGRICDACTRSFLLPLSPSLWVSLSLWSASNSRSLCFLGVYICVLSFVSTLFIHLLRSRSEVGSANFQPESQGERERE